MSEKHREVIVFIYGVLVGGIVTSWLIFFLTRGGA